MNEFLRLFGLATAAEVDRLQSAFEEESRGRIKLSGDILELKQENERIRKNTTEMLGLYQQESKQLMGINARLSEEIARLRQKYEPEVVEAQLQQLAEASTPEPAKKSRGKKATP